MRLPWEPNKSLTEAGYDMTYVQVYRALPSDNTSIRPGDYLTLSLKFAQEHAVTSAVYHGEDFAVVRALLKSSEVVGASNPDEYRFAGTQTVSKTRVVNLANEDGELLDPAGNPARFSRLARNVVSRYRNDPV